MTAPHGGSWVVVLGATSPIARAVAGELAARGHRIILAGRDAGELERNAADLAIRHGGEVATIGYDARDAGAARKLHAAVDARTAGSLEGVVAAVGMLGDAERAATDPGYAVEMIHANFTGMVAAVTGLANTLAARRAGFIIGIASVAGDRGRQSNYTYGAAKGGFALWLQGLRNRMWHHGVRVLTVKPGFVDTEMTYGLPGMFLVADPRRVGTAVVRALDRGRDVLYVPGFWRAIMWVIRAIPERLFKRLRL
jgi:decaprenylphospho-beta-D-erythro-pentofuranosid-2-ulose 2-reductase